MTDTRTVRQQHLEAATAGEIVAELERRGAAGHPVLAACPDCTRMDAIVVVHCGDHPVSGTHPLGGVFYFPLRPRAIAQLDLRLAPILLDADSKGIDLFELDSMKRRALES